MGAAVAAIMAVMRVGLVFEGPMVDAGVVVVGVAKGWRRCCVVRATVSWSGAPLLLSGEAGSFATAC